MPRSNRTGNVKMPAEMRRGEVATDMVSSLGISTALRCGPRAQDRRTHRVLTLAGRGLAAKPAFPHRKELWPSSTIARPPEIREAVLYQFVVRPSRLHGAGGTPAPQSWHTETLPTRPKRRRGCPVRATRFACVAPDRS